MKIARYTFIVSVCLASLSSVAVSQESKGYWIVVHSGKNSDNATAIRSKADRCGIRLFNDFSDKFSGFRSGYQVFVVEPSAPTRATAEAKLNQIKICFPEAYIKYGSYLGE